MKSNIMRNLCAYSLVFFTSLMSVGTVNATQDKSWSDFQPEGESKVFLVATLNNGPAMKPVEWSVYRLNNKNDSKLVKSFRRHSASLRLEPGRYLAQASLDNVNRSRIFDVRTFSNSNIVVAMDKQ